MEFSDEPVVSVKMSTIYQNQNTILSNVNFDISKGEFAYMIGRTGSGKSSLLKTLYADHKLFSGEIKVAGYSLENIKPKDVPYLRRKIGIVFQDFQLLTDRTVAENLLFAMRSSGWKDSSKMKQRLSDILINVGLGSVGNKMPHQLSGGEQQRVVIARALLNEPHILFADEPTGNLDPQVADEILDLFININHSGTAILMATHHHQFLKKHPARVLRCQSGNLIDESKEKKPMFPFS